MSTLQGDIEDCIRELRERIEENPDEREPHDWIHEIADSNVPIYYSDILQYAADDIDLATAEPEIGPAFDGSPTPINVIAANIFDRLEEALWEEWRRFEDQRDEAPECAICYEKVFEWQDSIVCTVADCEEVIHQDCDTPKTPDPYFCDTHLPEEPDDDETD